MPLGGGNFPYTFGFIDQLVRINFPQRGAKFLSFDNFGYYYTSSDGTNWTRTHSSFLSFENGGWTGAAFGPDVKNSSGAVTTDKAFVLAGTDGDTSFDIIVAWSKDSADWNEVSSGIPASDVTPANNMQTGFDDTTHTFWITATIEVNDESQFWVSTSKDGKAWTATEDGDVPSGLVTYQTSAITGTKVTPNDTHTVNRIPKTGTPDVITLPDRRLSNTAWGNIDKGGSGKGAFIAVGGNSDSGPNGPEIWVSLDDGNTWDIAFDLITGSPPNGLAYAVVGK